MVYEVTAEEYMVMDASLYFPIVISVLEKELKKVHAAPLSLGYVFSEIIEQKISEIRSDMAWARKKMYKLGMKLHKGQTDDMVICYTLFIRGRSVDYRFMRMVITNRIYEIINIYFGVQGVEGTIQDCRKWIEALKQARLEEGESGQT